MVTGNNDSAPKVSGMPPAAKPTPPITMPGLAAPPIVLPSAIDNIEKENLKIQRDDFAKAYFEDAVSFDKYILLLSSGSFGISITYIKEIIPDGVPIAGWTLVAAWIFFGASIITTLISFVSSVHSNMSKTHRIDNLLAGNKDEADKKKRKADWLNQCTIILNLNSLVCFILGIIFMIIFS